MRLIDADALMRYFSIGKDGRRYPVQDCDGFPVQVSLVDVKHAIRSAPTIDSLDHSYWNGWTTTAYLGRQDEFGDPVFADRKFYRCDSCRHGSAIKHNYCPNCGARMDGNSK